MPRESYACNLCVAEVDWSASSLTLGGQRGRPLGGCLSFMCYKRKR
jgi:hypothetical protein